MTALLPYWKQGVDEIIGRGAVTGAQSLPGEAAAIAVRP